MRWEPYELQLFNSHHLQPEKLFKRIKVRTVLYLNMVVFMQYFTFISRFLLLFEQFWTAKIYAKDCHFCQFCTHWIPLSLCIFMREPLWHSMLSELDWKPALYLKICSRPFQGLLHKGTGSFRYTLTRKNMNLPYSIRMYWTNFWQPTVHILYNKIFLKNSLKSR